MVTFIADQIIMSAKISPPPPPKYVLSTRALINITDGNVGRTTIAPNSALSLKVDKECGDA